MKAIVLCAGEGTRARPISYTLPKPMIPIANQPLVSYGIKAIRNVGIEQIGIIVGQASSVLPQSLGDGSDWGVQLSYIEQSNPRGLAHAVQISREFLNDDCFVMYLGDNILQYGLADMIRRFEDSNANALIALGAVTDPSSYGIVELEGQKIKRVVEKPKDPPSNLAIVGTYVFDKNIFAAIENIKPSWRNELEITDAIQFLIANDYMVRPYIVDGWWIDAGNPTDMIRANELVLSELTFDKTEINGQVDENSNVSARVVIGSGSEIAGSTIRGPVKIGIDCRLVNCYVGPFTAIGDNVLIENSEIEQSIIMDNCVIRNVKGRISESILANNCMLSKASQKPSVHRLVLAEHSLVEL